jgi:hypothetical protein
MNILALGFYSRSETVVKMTLRLLEKVADDI